MPWQLWECWLVIREAMVLYSHPWEDLRVSLCFSLAQPSSLAVLSRPFNLAKLALSQRALYFLTWSQFFLLLGSVELNRGSLITSLLRYLMTTVQVNFQKCLPTLLALCIFTVPCLSNSSTYSSQRFALILQVRGHDYVLQKARANCWLLLPFSFVKVF